MRMKRWPTTDLCSGTCVRPSCVVYISQNAGSLSKIEGRREKLGRSKRAVETSHLKFTQSCLYSPDHPPYRDRQMPMLHGGGRAGKAKANANSM
ncbi:hypothetical protein MPTK1_2g13360 [Marchantia polymorpha subsp. ruderalis]|uniref:Uncharacterized protein n=1 Tax=Marchantia polymorpha TaxID=3197 RepID=A0A2R6XAK2_MARPO|nr:hypothetical protein MARPO_0026s0036 [Marchantia polymorpha]BBN02174.1 hypothetical protein Mp_2g13360 [Marchantia polymorpha subsp. ruderalis]|eukprot:PTQ43145.1 hypothetical protein MARPO_0026s0036 [Marchantia polymorpha]